MKHLNRINKTRKPVDISRLVKAQTDLTLRIFCQSKKFRTARKPVSPERLKTTPNKSRGKEWKKTFTLPRFDFPLCNSMIFGAA